MESTISIFNVSYVVVVGVVIVLLALLLSAYVFHSSRSRRD